MNPATNKNVCFSEKFVNDNRIFENGGLEKLGSHATSTKVNVLFVVLKALSIITIVFAPLTFILIGAHYKKIAKQEIHNDNVEAVKQIAKKILGNDPIKDSDIRELYASKQISVDAFIKEESVSDIEQFFEQKILLETVDNLVPGLAIAYGVEESLVNYILKADGLTKGNHTTRQDEVKTVSEAIKLLGKEITDKFLYTGLTQENCEDKVRNFLAFSNVPSSYVANLDNLTEQGKASYDDYIKGVILHFGDEMVNNSSKEGYEDNLVTAVNWFFMSSLGAQNVNMKAVPKALKETIEYLAKIDSQGHLWAVSFVRKTCENWKTEKDEKTFERGIVHKIFRNKYREANQA